MTQARVLPETSTAMETLAAMEGPPLSTMAADEMRAAFATLCQTFDTDASSAVRTRDFEAGGVPVRAFLPASDAAGPVIMYMHGGGWVIGDLDTHHALCTAIAEQSGLRVVAIDYRLAPEAVFPAAHDDCLAASRHILAGPAELEGTVEGIIVAGDSAGGNLAFHLASTLGQPAVVAQLLFYPISDCVNTSDGSYSLFEEGYLLDRALMLRFLNEYIPDGPARNDARVSPLLHAIPASLPPAVVVTAALDPLRNEGRGLAARMVEAGVEVHHFEAMGHMHGFVTLRKLLPTGGQTVERAVASLINMVSGKAYGHP